MLQHLWRPGQLWGVSSLLSSTMDSGNPTQVVTFGSSKHFNVLSHLTEPIFVFVLTGLA